MHLTIFPEDQAPFTLAVKQGEVLADCLWLGATGLVAPSLCKGLGRCGFCRVRVEGAAWPPCAHENAVLGLQALNEGWRLACRHVLTPQDANLCVFVPRATAGQNHSTPLAPNRINAQGAVPQALVLAVDVGTTSIHWRALPAPDAGTEEKFAAYTQEHAWAYGRMPNPQSAAGSDVMSRLAASVTDTGRKTLATLLIHTLKDLVRSLEAHGSRVQSMVLAANPAMTAIFADVPVNSLCAAPYSLPLTGACELLVPGLPPAWIPPLPAPFVGGDVSAGVAAIMDKQPEYPFVLADMGTNGEFVLALDPHTSFIASVPLGPALEGIGLECGGVAAEGAISAFSLGPLGLKSTVIGDVAPQYLCGAGALSLVDVFLRTGFMDRAGQLDVHTLTGQAKKLASALCHGPLGWRFMLGPDVWLSVQDVESIVKVKAAFTVALQSLFQAAGLASGTVRAFMLAGSLGEHISPMVLENLGFFAPGSAQRTRAVGNSSLEGASLLLSQPHTRERLVRWSQHCRLVEVAHTPNFIQRYTEAMRFAW